MKLTKSDIQFSINGKPVKFSIVHNLKDKTGVSLEDALDNWLARTRNFTAKSLCKYIMSKDEEFVAMTDSEYKRISSSN